MEDDVADEAVEVAVAARRGKRAAPPPMPGKAAAKPAKNVRDTKENIVAVGASQNMR